MIIFVFFCLLFVGTYYDINYRKVPNHLTFGGMFLGLTLNFYFTGLYGLLHSIYGATLAFALLFIPFAMSGIGAGDVKFLMLVGSFQWPVFTFNTFLNGALIGGLYSLAVMAKNRKLVPFLKKIYYTVFFFTSGAVVYRSLETFEKNEQPLAIPYAVAITLGAVSSYWMRWL